MDPSSRAVRAGESVSAAPDRPFVQEWECFLREVDRLVAEGHEGRWALIKGEQVIGLFDTDREALKEAERHPSNDFEPFLVKRVQTPPCIYTDCHFRWSCPPIPAGSPGGRPRDVEPPTIHYSELGPAPPGSAIAQEWDFYRREAGRLIAQGYEGQWVLIKGEQIIGFFGSDREAMDEGYRRFLLQGFLVHQVQTREPVIRSTYHRCSCPTPH
jgi:hypothetical protein